jgi:hypothetical protein
LLKKLNYTEYLKFLNVLYWTPLTSLTLSYIYICKCLSQVRIRISNVICRGDFSVQWFDRWLYILLVINCSPPLFKLSFPYWRLYILFTVNLNFIFTVVLRICKNLCMQINLTIKKLLCYVLSCIQYMFLVRIFQGFILLVINCSPPLFKLSFPYWRLYYCYF